MNIREALADARIALRRGQRPRAQTILERLLREHPDNEAARVMLEKLRPSVQPAPAVPKMAPTSGYQATNPAAPRVITRKTSLEESVRSSNGRKAKQIQSTGSTPCPICKVMIRPGKMKTHNKHYHRRRKSDALDHAVYFGDSAGVAMIKASRKKRGG